MRAPRERRWVLSPICCLLYLAILLAFQPVKSQLPRASPIYSGSYSSKLNSQLKPPYPGSQTLWMRSVDISAPEGNDFTAALGIVNNAGAESIYQINGSMGCANGLLAVSFANFEGSGARQCKEIGTGGAPGLCEEYLVQSCTGDFAYSTYQTLDGSYELQIHDWCGIEGDVYLRCVGLCTGVVQCSSSISEIIIEGGTVQANGTQIVIVEGGVVYVNNTEQFNVQNSRNVTINAPADTININSSTQVTLQQSSSVNQTTINVDGDQNTFNFNTSTSSNYNIYTTAPASCVNYAQVSASRTSNFTVSTAAAARVTFDASTIEAPGSDWSLAPDSSTLQYDGQDTYAFALEACMLEGAIFNGVQAGLRIVFALYNYTSGSGVLFTLPTTTSLIYNHTNPSYIPSVCTGQVLVPHVYTGNRFAIFALLEFTDVASGTALLASTSWTISAMPVACKGSTLNVNLTAQFNGSDLVDGICSDATNPSPNTVAVDNTFDVTVSGHSCASRTGSRCSRNILIEAVCGFEDSDTVDFAETGTPGFYTAHVESELGNLTECVSCSNGTLTVRENVTLEVTRLCAETQCEVRVDPPQTTPSPGPQYVPRLCFTCGNSDGGGGGGGGDDDGDGTPPLPLVPPIVPIGFFPPIVPIFPPTGGTGGGSGGGSGGGPPGKLPILTPLPIGVTLEPTTIGGLQIPPTNFTDTVVFCGASTHGLAILENGTLPETLYICQRVFNGTYAWMPYCTCSSTQSNTTIIYYTTTVYLNSSTTLYVDPTSQIVSYGNTFLETLVVGSGGADVCQDRLRAYNITGCGTNSSSDRLTLDSAVIGLHGIVEVCEASRFGGSYFISANSIYPCTDVLELAPFGTTTMNNANVSDTLNILDTQNILGGAHLRINSAAAVDALAGSVIDIDGACDFRRQTSGSFAVTTMTPSVNGRMVELDIQASLFTTTEVAVMSITNPAITVATTNVRAWIIQYPVVSPATWVPPLLLVSQVYPSGVDLAFYYDQARGATGPNFAMKVMLEVLN